MRLLAVLFLIFNFKLYAKVISPEDEKILEQIRKSNTIKPLEKKKNKKDNFNKKARVVRDDSRILTESMSVNDRMDVMVCYNNPVIIKMGDTIDDQVNAVYIGNNKFFSAKKLEQNPRAVLVSVNEPITEKNGQFQTILWIERQGNKRSYIFNIIAEKCPDQGILPYPVEIIVEDKQGIVSKNQRILLSSDFITEITKGLPLDNSKNEVRVNGMITSANSDYIALGISLLFDYGKIPKRIKKPKFIFLDSLKLRIIDSKAEYLTYSSVSETNKLKETGNNLHALRFNLMLNSSKKYIYERKYVYALIVHEDLGYYQMVKIPLKELHDNLKNKGLEV